MMRFVGGAGLLVMAAVASCLLCGCTGRGGQLPAEESPGLAAAPDTGAAQPQATAGPAPDPAPASSAPGGLGRLPAPSELALAAGPPRGVSYVEADLVKAGQAYDPLLPHNRVIADEGLFFLPDWFGPGDTLEQLAYCVYSFTIPGYDRNAQLRYVWNDPPPQISQAWIGLADWDTDSWRWYRCNAAGKSNLGTLEPHLGLGGRLLWCMAVLGTEGGDLAEIRVGTQPPVAALAPGSRYGFTPLAVSFNGASSHDPDGSITHFEWDYDGDGTYDADTGSDPESEREYVSTGTYQAALRVTDNEGVSSVAHSSIGVGSAFVHTWGAANSDYCNDMAVDAAGNLYVAGYSYSGGVGTSGLLAKFSQAGQPLWTKAFDGAGDDAFSGVSVGPDKRIYVCGTTSSFGAGNDDGLLQCWEPDGSLVWSRAWGAGGDDAFNDLDVAVDGVFAVGMTAYDALNKDMLAARFDLTGGLVWDKSWGGNYPDELEAILYIKALFGSPVLHVVGHATMSMTPADIDLMYYTLNETGTEAKVGQGFGNNTEYQRAYGIYASLTFGSEIIIVGSNSNGSSSSDLLIVCPTNSWARTVNWGAKDTANDVARLASGEYVIAGTTSGGAVSDAFLLTINGEGLSTGMVIRDVLGQSDSATAVCSWAGGLALCGSAPSAGATWETRLATIGSSDGSWSMAPWGPIDLTASVSAANGSVSSRTDMVLDTGGGGADFLVELRDE